MRNNFTWAKKRIYHCFCLGTCSSSFFSQFQHSKQFAYFCRLNRDFLYFPPTLTKRGEKKKKNWRRKRKLNFFSLQVAFVLIEREREKEDEEKPELLASSVISREEQVSEGLLWWSCRPITPNTTTNNSINRRHPRPTSMPHQVEWKARCTSTGLCTSMVWPSIDLTERVEQHGKANEERIPVKPFSAGFEVNIGALRHFGNTLSILE